MVLCWKIGFCIYNILRGKMNCLTEFNFVKILKWSFFLCEVSNYKLNLHRIDFTFFLLFSNHFSCIQFSLSSYTYFIHQDSTRCETCNILNPIFYIFIIEIKYNGFLYLLFAYNYIHLLHFNSI